MKRNFLTLCLMFFVFALLTGTEAFAQSASVAGIIKDADGLPLEGVSVVEKGTNNGTVSNTDGRYTLSVKPNAVLVFSFSGYREQEEKVGKRSTVNISLEADEKQLSEVVVTALGIKRASKDLGYSVQILDGEKVSTAKELNVTNSLQGQVAGVYVNQSSAGPGGSTYINIRGASSIAGNNLPLFVVDGVPIDNQQLGMGTYAGAENIGRIGGPTAYGAMRDYGDGIGNINPEDIESLSVLKGASASALYGSRGAHGVVLITTKKGKTGRARIDFNSNATFETINVIPKVQNKYGGGYGDSYDNLSPYVINGQPVLENGVPVSVYGNVMDNWGGAYDGRPIVFQNIPGMSPIPYKALNSSPWKDFFRTGSTFTNSVAVSGGTEKAVYRLSLSDLENKGITPNNSMSRQSIDFSGSFHATSKLTIEAKINYIRQNVKNPPETGGASTSVTASLARTASFVPLTLAKDYITDEGKQNNFINFGVNNPYWLMNKVTATGGRDRIIGYILARYKFNDWLNMHVRSGTDFYNDSRLQKTAKYTQGYSSGRGQVDEMKFSVKEDNSDILITAAGKLSNNVKGSFSTGGNHRRNKTDMLSVIGSQLIIPDLYTTNNATRVTSYQYPTEKVINSAYFSGQLGYKDFLFLDITGRNDWSSSLGLNNYSFFYPSVSGTFIFSDVLPKTSSFLNFGKLRVSYSHAGNDADPYLTSGGYQLTGANYNGNLQASINGSVPLADLKNELSKSYEVGTELRLLNERLSLDFTYYSSRTLNQITPIQISAATGYYTRLINAGEIRNRGIEIFANVTPVRTRDFKWDITFNFSRNKSKVVSLAPGVETYLLLETYNGATIQAVPGEAFGNIMGIPFARVDEKSPSHPGAILLNSDGVWQSSDKQQVLGNIQPDWLGGITNTFTYKNFTLGALLDIRQGGQIFSMTKYMQMASGTGKFTENRTNLIADGVILQPDGSYKQSDIVLLAQDYYASQGPWSNIAQPMIINASYIALRQATLGYNFGRTSLLKKTPFKAARLSVVARNLFYLKIDPQFKQMGLSPETAFNTTFGAQGQETAGLPTTRSIGFNLSFSF
ncbi:MAG: SusC/RagA family TonB-linked outer membrane protein [Chitinophagaceae bacterium]|nr:SusC/RagA family TonB-linked outer membrane protein [Chitinophagaceae bacterium]